MSKTWKVENDLGKEERDAIYIASEFVKSVLYYPFHSEPSWKEKNPSSYKSYSGLEELMADLLKDDEEDDSEKTL